MSATFFLPTCVILVLSFSLFQSCDKTKPKADPNFEAREIAEDLTFFQMESFYWLMTVKDMAVNYEPNGNRGNLLLAPCPEVVVDTFYYQTLSKEPPVTIYHSMPRINVHYDGICLDRDQVIRNGDVRMYLTDYEEVYDTIGVVEMDSLSFGPYALFGNMYLIEKHPVVVDNWSFPEFIVRTTNVYMTSGLDTLHFEANYTIRQTKGTASTEYFDDKYELAGNTLGTDRSGNPFYLEIKQKLLWDATWFECLKGFKRGKFDVQFSKGTFRVDYDLEGQQYCNSVAHLITEGENPVGFNIR